MTQMNIRISILRLVAAVIVAVLVYNLFHIQVIEGQHWANMAENNRVRHLVETAPRGRILSADGVELAGSIPSYEVALAYEHDSEKQNQTVLKLAELLEVDPEDIFAKLSAHRRRFEPVKIANVDFETVLLLEEYRHLMSSLVIQINPQRYYPEKTLLAHTLGRVDGDGIGTEGLERHWQDYLKGENGFSVIHANASGRPVSEPVSSQPAVPGNDLQLTIDAGLQRVTQESLNRVLTRVREELRAEEAWAGAVVVMDPNTGAILAMVTEPAFDNNRRYASDWDALFPEEMPNWARSRLDRTVNYRRPVGSTFKMLTGLAALETNKVTATERIYDSGVTMINDFRTRNYASRAYGNINMRRALEVSSNIYFGTLGARMGANTIYDYIHRFGMSKAMKNAGFSDIDLREQLHAIDAREGNPWYGGDTVQLSYGQKNEYTPMQMANYVSMLANGGTHYQPHVVDKVIDVDGNVVPVFVTDGEGNEVLREMPYVIAEQNFVPHHLKAVQEGMLDAARSSSNLRNLPVTVAGKTGTAEPGGNRDSMSWWVGYAPYEEPEIAIVVFLEYGGLGSRSTEVAKDIIEYYFGE